MHRLFRRSHLIGRRFKLVHVLFGPETVEVSTFRAGEGAPKPTSTAGVLRDNVYGTRVQDAARRDFTVNALYYDPHDETVLDYHGGFADVRKKTMRIIGDPALRFREDPVRMLRAVRFAAKLGFTHRPEDARADPRLGRPDRERARPAPVRRNAEAAAVRPRGGLRWRNCARKACTTACCRCST